MILRFLMMTRLMRRITHSIVWYVQNNYLYHTFAQLSISSNKTKVSEKYTGMQ